MPITEEELAQAVAKAKAEAKAEAFAEAKAQAERTKQVYALETTDEVKALLASDEFANVEIAGVQANPSDFVQKTDEEIEQAEAEKSAEKLAKLGSVL